MMQKIQPPSAIQVSQASRITTEVSIAVILATFAGSILVGLARLAVKSLLGLGAKPEPEETDEEPTKKRFLLF